MPLDFLSIHIDIDLINKPIRHVIHADYVTLYVYLYVVDKIPLLRLLIPTCKQFLMFLLLFRRSIVNNTKATFNDKEKEEDTCF